MAAIGQKRSFISVQNRRSALSHQTGHSPRRLVVPVRVLNMVASYETGWGKQGSQLEKSADHLSPNRAMASPASITIDPANLMRDTGLSDAPINPK